MSLNYNSQNYEFGLNADDDFAKEAIAVQQTMNTPGWKVLEKYFNSAKDLVVEALADGAEVMNDERLRASSGVLKGVLQFREIPKLIIEAYKQKQDELNAKGAVEENYND